MRVVVTLAVASAALAAAPPPRADEVTLTDGRRLPATLTLEATGRLHFTAADRSDVAPDCVQYLRFGAATVAPFRAGVVHQVRLTRDQRLTGELLALDAGELRLRVPWRDRLAVPRGVLVGVTTLPGRVVLCDEDFEEGLKAWKITGTPQLTTKQHTSGEHALLFDAPGQSAAYVLPSPPEAGSAAVNFCVPDEAAGAKWQVEAEFQGSAGARVVRLTVADAGNAYAAEAPTPRDAEGEVARRPGWHRLTVEFGPTSLIVTIDDAVLWYSREKGPGGSLREVRLTCVADKGAVRGAVAFDEFTLTRAVEVLPRPSDTAAQDEVWLTAGDQIFGRLTRLDRRGLELDGRFGKRTYSWAEARGAFPERTAVRPATTEGAHVRLWLRPAAGSESDELEGVLHALDDRRLTLRHAALGGLGIDRARLLRLKPLFHGKRIELDNGTHHLGEKGRLAPGVQPARAEGPDVEYAVRLEARPETARLALTLVPIEGLAEIVVNGRVIEDLTRYAGPKARAAVPMQVALPRDSLKAGANVIAVRVREEAGRHGSCVVSEVALELPQ
jgi:hypothetical protein